MKLDRREFPDQPSGSGGLPATIANVRFLLAGNGISVRYNLVKKRTDIRIPQLTGASDNLGDVALTHIRSLMALHGMAYGDDRSITDAIANEVPYSPVADWIDSRPWDGVDRLPELYATLTTEDDFPAPLKEAILYHWLLGAVAAAKIEGFSSRLVLTLSGPQSIGKTRWCISLVPEPTLRAAVVKTDHHFEGGDKDPIITAMRHWIVELGELESSFRKDAERLKGIITRDRDVVRIPYAKTDAEWPRRTVFMATANGSDFLADPTGSTRWGVLPVVAVDHEHGVDMQQVFAQLAVDLEAGAQWWLRPEAEAQMQEWNERHQTTSIVRDVVATVVDLEGDDTAGHARMTASDVLREGGIDSPTNPQAREAGGILRARFGTPSKSGGVFGWRLPLRRPPDAGQDHRAVAVPSASKSKFD